MAYTWTERRPTGVDEDRKWGLCAIDSDGSHIVVGSILYSDGRIFGSTDYGVTWNEYRPAGDVDYYWLSLATNGDGSYILAGQWGKLYLSKNSGSTWTEVKPYTYTGDRVWRTAAVSGDGRVMIVGTTNYGNANDGRLWLSLDYGVTWNETRPNGDNVLSWVSAEIGIDGSNIVVVSQDTGHGDVYYSSNHGSSWTKKTLFSGGSSYWLSCAIDSNGSTMSVCGPVGAGFYISPDSGATWNLTAPAGGALNERSTACDADGSVLVLTGSNGRIYTSINSGSTWVEERPAGDVDVAWYDSCISNNGSRLAVVCYSGRVWTAYDPTLDYYVIISTYQPIGRVVHLRTNVDNKPIAIGTDMNISQPIGEIAFIRLNADNVPKEAALISTFGWPFGAATAWYKNVRVKIPASAITKYGGGCKLVFNFLFDPPGDYYYCYGGEGKNINHAAFGPAATAGNAWDFAAAPTEVTFSGSTSAVLSEWSAEKFYSDTIPVAITPGTDYILSVYYLSGEGGGSTVILTGATPAGGSRLYNKNTGTDESQQIAPAGYDAGYADVIYVISEMVVLSPSGTLEYTYQPIGDVVMIKTNSSNVPGA